MTIHNRQVQVYEGQGVEPADWNEEDWVTLTIHRHDGQPKLKQDYETVKVTQRTFDLLKGKHAYRVDVNKNATAQEYKVTIKAMVIGKGEVLLQGAWLLTLGDEYDDGYHHPKLSVDKIS
jgi:hypothetical protein